MLKQPITVLSWNVRGLNISTHRDTVRETIAASSCHLVCLQETKLDVVDKFTDLHVEGSRLCCFAQRPATDTRGGILLLWDDKMVDISNISASIFCLSAMVNIKGPYLSYKITIVYGPSFAALKGSFFAELTNDKPPRGVSWLALEDFNQIYCARDKNKRNVNTSRIT